MPRKRRTLPVAAPQDQGYGQRGEQMAAQHALPLPDNRGSVTPISAAPSALAPAPAQPAVSLEQALQAARQMTPPQGGLDRPSEQPDTPFTAGLTTGAGPGPEAVGGQIDPVLDYLKAAYKQMPTPAIAALIEAAQS